MLQIVPISISDAKAFVAKTHRHRPDSGINRFAVAVGIGSEIVGVALVGNPKARRLQDGWTCEVTRLATDGSKNACSMLYRAAWRAAKALGYRRLVTYTLDTETGTSLKAAGFKIVAEVRGRSWDCKSRPRVDRHPIQNKIRWELSTAPRDGAGKGEGA